jgi:PAS domain S-box-containing protein
MRLRPRLSVTAPEKPKVAGTQRLRHRVLVLPTTSADGAAIGKVFAANEIEFELCADMRQLCESLGAGAGLLIVSEESVLKDASALIACVSKQPVWSDLPIIVLSRSGRESTTLADVVATLGNVSVVERPIRTSTLITLVRSSLRARERQYDVREYLVQQEKAQRLIREGERRYRSLIDNVADYAIFMTDAQGRITTWNGGAEAMLGYTTDEAIGQPIDLFSTTEDVTAGMLPKQMELARHTGRGTGENWKVRKDARRLYIESVSVTVLEENGQLLGFAHFLRDVTEKHRIATEREQLLDSERAARNEAERASRTKDEFLATLSHELRTPLNAVIGWTQVLRRTPGLPPDATNALNVIDRNARAQAQIIADLLDMSSIISGKVRLDVQRLDMASIIEATVETVRPTAQAKGVRLKSVLDPKAGPVRGDPNRLQQVLWNLLTNAVKFTPKDGLVTVSLARVNSHLEIEVADSGEGIDPTFLPHVFDRFRQADASTIRRHGGLGLGLSIVKQLVELHAGSITAKSPGPALGSSFRVSLPLMAANDPIDSPSQQALAETQTQAWPVDGFCDTDLSGMTVLVVDDELDARSLIQRLLQDCKADVITAASVAEALEIIVGETPDVIVSDIGMPGEDGYGLIRRVRALKNGKSGIPAIALTAYARIEDRVKAINAGFQLHLSKPVEPVELVAMVNSLVKRPAAGPLPRVG